jgi:1D-myo-inositol-tetrakisphosphate 5-kinase/inositol-polyphosphate multikinase
MASLKLNTSNLKPLANAAAGHDGVLSDESGELIIKPCTNEEVTFYQQTLAEHPDFAELMPTFMGTLSLGAPDIAAAGEVLTQEQKDRTLLHGKKVATQTAIVIENLEYGFKRANVLDLKLGSRLYADGTEADKAARLDKVASETTSGSLNFRMAGMKVWNQKSNDFDVYDKFYGRQFNASDVSQGFETFFASLLSASEVRQADAALLLETILADVTKARHLLEKAESRMYGASVLIVYEGDSDARDMLMGGELKTPRVDERAPTQKELEKSVDGEEDGDEDAPPVAFQVKMIDFAHATWTTGQGMDENVVKGLKNVEAQLDGLIARIH